MKLQNLSVIFSIIVIPIILVMTLMMTNKLNDMKMEIAYNTALYTATRDGIKALEYNSQDNRFKALADTIVRDAKATVNTFINSLAMNLGLGDSGVESLKPYIPAIAYIMYDGYYIYTPDIAEKDNPALPGEKLAVLEHSLKPYSYYTKEYRTNDGKRVVINYTLDNFVKVYIYRGTADYNKGEFGYIMSVHPTKGIYYDNMSNIVKYKNIEITDAVAKDFYIKAYNFTKKMQDLGPLTYTYVKTHDNNENGIIEEALGEVTYLTSTINGLFNITEEESIFEAERYTVLKDTLQSSLNTAIGNYNLISQATGSLYNFKMPVLSDTDWDTALSNFSMITFLQGINIGNKYYNNYAVTASFSNSYYVPENEMCFVQANVLHKIDCQHLTISPTIYGKYFDLANELEVDNSYKYESCYYCFVDGNYTKKDDYTYKVGEPEYKKFDELSDSYKKAYYSAYAKAKEETIKRYNLNY